MLDSAGLAEYSCSIVFAFVEVFRGLRRELVKVGFDVLYGNAGSSTASIEGAFLAGELEKVMEGGLDVLRPDLPVTIGVIGFLDVFE